MNKKPETDQEYNELWAKCMGLEFHGFKGDATQCCAGLWKGNGILHDCELSPVNDMSQCWMLVERVSSMFNPIDKEEFSPLTKIRILWPPNLWAHTEKEACEELILTCALALGKLEE